MASTYMQRGWYNAPPGIAPPLNGPDTDSALALDTLPATGKVFSCLNNELGSLVVAGLVHAGLPPEVIYPPADPSGPKYQTVNQHQSVVAEAGQVDQIVQEMQGGNPILNKDFIHLPANILEKIVQGHPEVIGKERVDDNPDSCYQYGFTSAGFWLVRPPSGWLLEWGSKSKIPLRTALGNGKPGVVSAEGDIEVADSVITRMQVLAALASRSYASITKQEIGRFNRGTIGDFALRGHLGSLVDSGLVTKSGTKQLHYRYADPDIKAHMSKLLVIYRKMAELDPAFIAEGHALADRFISTPRLVRAALRRFEEGKQRRPVAAVIQLDDFVSRRTSRTDI